jgi:hypothetical protein
MKFLPLLAFGTLAALSLDTSWSQAAEVRLAVAPRIDLPKDLPLYHVELSAFYGTAISELISPALRTRVETQLGHKTPAALEVTAEQIAHTSILSVVVIDNDDPAAATTYLSTLVDQFLKFRAEQKKKAYADAIAHANEVIATAPKELVPGLTSYRDNLVMASLLDNADDLEKAD